jgi:aldehyde:ferredoxin oxidoreductase
MMENGEGRHRVLLVPAAGRSDRKIKEPIDPAFAWKYFGGRGFTSRFQYDLIPVDVDPLGPENVLIFAPGALTGSTALSMVQ